MELRSRIDTLRIREGLQAFAWTDPTLEPGVTAIRSIHLTELRTALEEVYGTVSLAWPTYEEPIVRAGDTIIRAAHVMELRAAVLALAAR